MQNLISNFVADIVSSWNKSETYPKICTPFNTTTAQTSSTSCPTLASTDSLKQTQLISRLTAPCRYDRFEPPFPVYENNCSANQPLDIYLRIYVYDLRITNAADVELKIFGFLQLRYTDFRLAFGVYAPKRSQPILGDAQLRERIWVPHILFVNEQDSAILGTGGKDISIRIMPDGMLTISTRIQVTLSCAIGLSKFPFDDQQCTAVIESWLYNSSEIMLHWEHDAPVTFEQNLHLSQYSLENTWSNETVAHARKGELRYALLGGNYSSISFTAYLNRKSLFYTMDYFLPSIMLVCMSWVSFWLQADQTPARTTLGTSTMLSLFTLTSYYEKQFGRKSHVQFFEIWFFSCTFFIFGSLMEFAFVNTIWRRSGCLSLKKVNSKYILKSTLTPKVTKRKFYDCETDGRINFYNRNTCNLPSNKVEINVIGTDSPDANNQSKVSQDDDSWSKMTPHEVSLWIDRKARFVFPLMFIIFNAIYWAFVFCS